MPVVTVRPVRHFRQAALLPALTLALLGSPAFAAEPDIGQQQLINLRDRTENLANLEFVPSQDIPPQIPGVEPSPAAQRQSFAVRRINVTGATVYSASDLAPVLQPYLGRPNTLSQLYQLATAIAAKYRADGYPFTTVTVPGQHLVNGDMVLHVTEFSVGAVDFTLDDKAVPTPAPLLSVVADILASHPVRQQTLETAETRARAMPDLRVATTRIRKLADGKLRLSVMLTRPGDKSPVIQPSNGGTAPEPDATPILVRQIRVTGNTAYTDAELAPLFAGLTGRAATLGELRAAAQRVAGRYAAGGYFGTTASVPPQVIHDGVVTIEVAELKIHAVSVRLNGTPLGPNDLLVNAANAITVQQPATSAAIQRQLYILNNIPGVLVESVIPPVTGDEDAELYLRRKPWGLTTALDNRGTQVSGPLELGAMLQEDGQLGFNEELQLLGLKTIPSLRQVTYTGFQGIVPLSHTGLVATGMISHTLAKPGGYLAPQGVAAIGDMLSLGLTYPVIARAGLSSLMTFAFDAFNNSATVFNGQFTSSDERSRAARFGNLTTWLDPLGGVSIIKTVFTKGVDGLGARPNGMQVNTRPGISLNASKIVLDIRRDQPLPFGLKLAVGFKGQYAFAPLSSAEVMTFGGVDFGRAYDSGVISGDHGIAGKAQLSRGFPLTNPVIPFVEPFIFYDNGEVFSLLKTPGVSTSASAASTGVGSRFATSVGFGGSVEADMPLTHAAKVNTQRKPARVFFLLFAQF